MPQRAAGGAPRRPLSTTRRRAPGNPGALVWRSLIALLLLVVSGWLGGKMVYVMRVAVTEDGETQADVRAPIAREAARRA